MTGADHSGSRSTPEPERMVGRAADRGKVIRCAPSDGPQTDYLNVGRILPLRWVAWRETDSEAHIVHRDTVARAVENAMPAAWQIAEEESRWGDGE